MPNSNMQRCAYDSGCTSRYYPYCNGGFCMDEPEQSSADVTLIVMVVIYVLAFGLLAFFRPLRGPDDEQTPMMTFLSVILAIVFFPAYLVGLIVQNARETARGGTDYVTPGIFCCLSTFCCGPFCIPGVFWTIDYGHDKHATSRVGTVDV